jgi:hypothetical protein
MSDRLRSSLAELVAIIEHHCSARIYDLPYEAAAMTRARALLAEAQPQPGQPTDEQIESAFREWWKDSFGFPYFGAVPLVACVEWTKAAMARWGRPAPEPVSVAERMPTAQDCGADGLCWFWYPGIYEACFPWWSLEPFERGEQATHWLPHWALPVPQEQADG